MDCRSLEAVGEPELPDDDELLKPRSPGDSREGGGVPASASGFVLSRRDPGPAARTRTAAALPPQTHWELCSSAGSMPR